MANSFVSNSHISEAALTGIESVYLDGGCHFDLRNCRNRGACFIGITRRDSGESRRSDKEASAPNISDAIVCSRRWVSGQCVYGQLVRCVPARWRRSRTGRTTARSNGADVTAITLWSLHFTPDADIDRRCPNSLDWRSDFPSWCWQLNRNWGFDRNPRPNRRRRWQTKGTMQ